MLDHFDVVVLRFEPLAEPRPAVDPPWSSSSFGLRGLSSLAFFFFGVLDSSGFLGSPLGGAGVWPDGAPRDSDAAV